MAAEPEPHTDDRPAGAEQVLAIVRRVATELKPQAPPPAMALDSRLDEDARRLARAARARILAHCGGPDLAACLQQAGGALRTGDALHGRP
jgi:hypothetical protein